MTRLLSLALLLCSTARASETEDALNQARHFMKKQWHADAIQELEAALSTPAGRSAFEVHALLAEAYFLQHDALNSKKHAVRALELNTEPSRKAEIRRFLDFLNSNFGVLSIVSPYPGMESAIVIEVAAPILDPRVAQYQKALSQKLASGTVLPTKLAFPAGRFTVNGKPVTVRSNEETSLQLSMKALGATGLSALQVSRVELAMGPAALFATRTNNLRPSFDTQLSISQPFDSWIVGVLFDYSLRSFNVEGEGLVVDPFSYSAGLRVGREFLLGGPLAVRPSVGYRFGFLPGVGLSCQSADAADPFMGPYQCKEPQALGMPPDLKVYAVGRTHFPFSELSIDYRHAGRTTALGLGVKVIGEYAIGKIESESTAVVKATGEEIAYSTQATSYAGASFRMLANVSFAF